jgi:hypothetical protein
MEKMVKIHEKVQISWGVSLFKKFILFATERGTFSSSQADRVQKELAELDKAIQGKGTSQLIAEELNRFIDKVNREMKENSALINYAPFPLFSFMTKRHEKAAVLDQFDMLERTLTEAAAAKMIEWSQESEYFITILQIFKQVEDGKIGHQEAMAQLAGEIEKINATLPEKFKLPVIDLKAYE